MIDTLLALVPTYGVWLIMISVALSCLALPIPSSMLVMAAGGFSAAGDFPFWQLVLCAYSGFLIGDQVAFAIARFGGAPLLARLRTRASSAKVLDGAQDMISRHGSVAVVLSRTVLSPTAPYVSYVSGALGFDWAKFTAAAAFGAIIWCAAYSGLGYVFTSRIAEIAEMIGSSIGVVLAGVVTLGLLWWLVRSYRAERAKNRL